MLLDNSHREEDSCLLAGLKLKRQYPFTDISVHRVETKTDALEYGIDRARAPWVLSLPVTSTLHPWLLEHASRFMDGALNPATTQIDVDHATLSSEFDVGAFSSSAKQVQLETVRLHSRAFFRLDALEDAHHSS